MKENPQKKNREWGESAARVELVKKSVEFRGRDPKAGSDSVRKKWRKAAWVPKEDRGHFPQRLKKEIIQHKSPQRASRALGEGGVFPTRKLVGEGADEEKTAEGSHT